MNKITITNITRKDYARKQIRILAHQKDLFPAERPGFPKTYDITIVWGDNPYNCTYTIGSKDGKFRSGILRLKGGLAETLGNKVRNALICHRIAKNQYHLIPAI
ncbi:MAG TPA: hypothetical protein VG605_15790 [Puia sp.]|nr:hypothetical protein [Puia sp.]